VRARSQTSSGRLNARWSCEGSRRCCVCSAVRWRRVDQAHGGGDDGATVGAVLAPAVQHLDVVRTRHVLGA
jgi:hypothetical protein